MIAFINAFLSQLLVMIVFFIIIVIAVLLGKKLRENKDAKDALMATEEKASKDVDTSEKND